MPRFLALRIEHKLDDFISFCVSAVVLAAAQITQESSRFLFEVTARFANSLQTLQVLTQNLDHFLHRDQLLHF